MAMFSFVGAENYLKEIEEQKKYEEAFQLKKDTLGISSAQLKLAQDKFKLDEKNTAIATAISLANLMKDGGGYGTGTSGVKVTKGGKISGTSKGTATGLNIRDNETASKILFKDFPNLSTTAFENIVGTEGLGDFAVSKLYDMLSELKTNLGGNKMLVDGRFPKDVVTEIANNLSTIDYNPYNAKFIPDSLMKLLDETQQAQIESLSGQVSKIFAPISYTEQREGAAIKDFEAVERNVYQNLDSRIKTEEKDINLRIGELNQNTSMNPLQQAELAWLMNRQSEIESANNRDFSSTNRSPLFQLYGTFDDYLSAKEIYKNRVAFPSDPNSVPSNLKIKTVIPKVEALVPDGFQGNPTDLSVELVRWLSGQHPNSPSWQRNGWILKVGQTVFVPGIGNVKIEKAPEDFYTSNITVGQ
jgi:hypothetical protein